MSKVSRKTVDTETSLVADGMGAVLIDAGRPFQARDAATGNARSPSVDRFVSGTTSVSVTDERRRRQPSVQHIDADYRRGMMELFRKDSGMTTHTTGTRSQWSSLSSGVVWSVLLAEKISRAAAFRTDCSLLSY